MRQIPLDGKKKIPKLFNFFLSNFSRTVPLFPSDLFLGPLFSAEPTSSPFSPPLPFPLLLPFP